MLAQKHLVCQGATCQCQFGNAPDKLKVLTQTKAFINEEEPQEKLVATTADVGATFEKNTFGLCKLQPTNLYVMLLLKPNGVFVFMIK
ncbi:PAAR-like protein [Capnocytophaga sputigena]|uniref:PAAR-like protein n=1 Tax=Capnocytophaga sputigena TaxID=1019 RepID=UPI0028D38263|nr:PAAR-like protein [Capnocytophaga sputigena]